MLTCPRPRFSVKRENGVHHFQRLVAEFMQREYPTLIEA